jgi:hypothetical protein
MVDRHFNVEHVPLQDRDLLQRLNAYFDTLDTRLRMGEGWLIFNATGARAQRINQFLLYRMQLLRPLLSYQFMPWRDFSLTAYMVQVELKALTAEHELTGKAKQEFDIATRVSRQSMVGAVTADLLVLSGLRPQHTHEVTYLEDTIGHRYRGRLATIILTPEQPHELAEDISRHSELGAESWRRMSEVLYETSLVAI